MCTIWSTNDPPDILEGTEQLVEIYKIINMNIEEDFAVELYDMNLKEATTSLYEFCKKHKAISLHRMRWPNILRIANSSEPKKMNELNKETLY